MLGQEFELRGTYTKAPGYKLYLRLKVIGLGDASGEMLQISDGKTLWDFQQLLKTDRAFSDMISRRSSRRLMPPISMLSCASGPSRTSGSPAPKRCSPGYVAPCGSTTRMQTRSTASLFG